MKNPFPFDRINIGDCFYGRNDALEKIKQTVSYGNNLLIYSKRRTGKSALVTRFGELNEHKYLLIYVDLFDIISKEDFAKHLLKALANSTKLDVAAALKHFGAILKRTRVEATIDPNSGKTSLKPIVNTLSFEEMLDDFFGAVSALEKEKNVVIALDEFQQIDDFKKDKLDASLRKYIQNRGEKVSFIFLGSKRHLLTSLFQANAPLFEMATYYELPPLEFTAIQEYVTKYLEISEDMIRYIQKISANEMKLMQNIFYMLYALQGEKMVTKESIENAIAVIVGSKDTSYRMILDSLSSSQKCALKIIGKYHSGFYVQEIFNEYGISKQSLQSAVNALFKKEIIDKEANAYFIPDRAFELWIEREN